MPYSFDPEILAVMEPMLEMRNSMPKIPAGDAHSRRAMMEPMLTHLLGAGSFPEDVISKDYHATASDDSKILCRWYAKKDAAGTSPGPAILHTHGGGMILGSVNIFDKVLANQVSMTGVPVMSVDYRLAPEFPHPTPTEDCYAGLVLLRDNAKELNVDPARIAIMGESAGGGIAAGVALMARDRKLSPPLAKQILVYPMLDDRTTIPDPQVASFAFWSYDDNITGWKALLGEKAGGAEVSEYAAPARAKDLSGLPPTYIDVGQLDIFLYEDMEYAKRISQSGTNVEFHLHPGVPHAYDGLAPLSDVSKRTFVDRFRVMKSF